MVLQGLRSAVPTLHPGVYPFVRRNRGFALSKRPGQHAAPPDLGPPPTGVIARNQCRRHHHHCGVAGRSDIVNAVAEPLLTLAQESD